MTWHIEFSCLDDTHNNLLTPLHGFRFWDNMCNCFFWVFFGGFLKMTPKRSNVWGKKERVNTMMLKESCFTNHKVGTLWKRVNFITQSHLEYSNRHEMYCLNLFDLLRRLIPRLWERISPFSNLLWLVIPVLMFSDQFFFSVCCSFAWCHWVSLGLFCLLTVKTSCCSLLSGILAHSSLCSNGFIFLMGSFNMQKQNSKKYCFSVIQMNWGF